jgi:hypothetical protein
MPDESPAKRGDAAWKEQRDAISQRNAEAHKRAQGDRRTRMTQAAAAGRAEGEREAAQLRELNAKIQRRKTRAGQ